MSAIVIIAIVIIMVVVVIVVLFCIVRKLVKDVKLKQQTTHQQLQSVGCGGWGDNVSAI